MFPETPNITIKQENYIEDFSTEADPRAFNEEILEQGLSHEETSLRIYSERLNEHMTFDVFTRWDGNFVKIEFQVNINTEGKYVKKAEFAFNLNTAEDHLDLHHRLVETQEYGITGSKMLKKTENILLTLFDKGFLEKQVLFLNAGQQHVIQWALKNGFNFIDTEKSKVFQDIQENPNEYKTNVSIHKTTDGYPRDGYIFDKSVAKKLSIPDDGKVTVDTLKDHLPKAKRFSLIKEI